MAGTNTEKPTGKAEKMKTAPVMTKNTAVSKLKTSTKKVVKKTETEKSKQKANSIKETVKTEGIKKEIAQTQKNNEKKKVSSKKVKKSRVTVNAKNVPVSTKVAIAICRFIRKKDFKEAIENLESVIKLKKAVPMKGEIPHRKGKIMSGRFPIRAAKEFIVLVKQLEANANQHDLEGGIISEAIANKGETTYAKGGRARKKRTNILLIATQKKTKERINKKKKNSKKNSEEKK